MFLNSHHPRRPRRSRRPRTFRWRTILLEHYQRAASALQMILQPLNPLVQSLLSVSQSSHCFHYSSFSRCLSRCLLVLIPSTSMIDPSFPFESIELSTFFATWPSSPSQRQLPRHPSLSLKTNKESIDFFRDQNFKLTRHVRPCSFFFSICWWYHTTCLPSRFLMS